MISLERIEALYERKRTGLVYGMRRVVRGLSLEDAEDAVAFAFCQLVAYRDRMDDTHVEGWLFTVARRSAVRGLRPEPLPLFDTDEVGSDGPRIEARETLERLLALRPNRRTAMVARMLGLSYKETAEATGQTYTWINRHTTEGRAELRELEKVA